MLKKLIIKDGLAYEEDSDIPLLVILQNFFTENKLNVAGLSF
jgi:hypothetical protein